MNFCNLKSSFSNYASSEIVILPVPYDGTSTWMKGADYGPNAILEASANLELYDIETDSEVYRKGIHTLPPIIETQSPYSVYQTVRKEVSAQLKKGKFVVMIGGEHSISAGAFQAFADHVQDLTIIQLDAHADLRKTYHGSKLNHACVMRKAVDLKLPFVQVGIRSMDISEKTIMISERTFFAKDIAGAIDWQQKVIPLLSRNVYITIDLDVFDPSVMPSTGTPEPGGLGWYEVLKFLKMISESCNVVGFDVVELCPNPHNKASDFLAAKLIYKLLSYKFEI
jgi:agmatinase